MNPFDLRSWEGFVEAGGDPATPAIIDQVTIDSRQIDSSKALFVALPGKVQDGHQFIPQALQAGAMALVKKSWPASSNSRLLRVDDPLKAFQAIAVTYRKQKKCRVIGIAGSFGKTMVKDLLQLMLEPHLNLIASPDSYNSQIGVPLSLLRIRDEHEIALIEAAISHPNEMDTLASLIAPDCGLLTPIGKKHIATLGDLPTIAKELIKLFLHARGWLLLPNDPHLPLEQLKAPIHFWNELTNELPQAHLISEGFSYRVDFPDKNSFSGLIDSGYTYFVDLLNMAVKTAWLLDIPSSSICETLRYYHPEPIRSEIWTSPTGAIFFNETYGSTPHSVDQALRHLEEAPKGARRLFIFGGLRGHHSMDNDYRRIAKAIQRANVDHLFLAKPDPTLISELQTPYSICSDTQEAIQQIEVKEGDHILIKGASKVPFDLLTESLWNNLSLINLAAIQNNIETLRQQLPPKTRLMGMVKAFAYGTDELRIAKFLATCDVDILGVAYVDEAIKLKRSGIQQSLFVINAAPYEAAKVVKWGLEVAVSDKLLIQTLAHEAKLQNKNLKVHLHVDTGMSRFGCRPEDALDLARQIATLSSLQLEGIMTHFACADNPQEDPFTQQQVRTFDQTIQLIESAGISLKWKHAANSSAAARFYLPQYNMARPGLAIYGLYNSVATQKALELRLALSLVSRIVGINICRAGETISYGRHYTVERDQQRIAILPIGYFDGLHRNYSGKGHVIIRGQKAPMVGKICMDYTMVDVSHIPSATVGDRALIFGENEFGHYLSPEDLASSGDSIVNELITCLGPRIPRLFIHEEAQTIR
jgi:Alr-MurF fusion protein